MFDPDGDPVWDIDFVNKSTVVVNEDLELAIAAFQRQVNEHFGPLWFIGAKLNIVEKAGKINPTIFIMDTSDTTVPGYHDINDASVPVAFVYAKTAKDTGTPWQIQASHELLSLLLDPYANLASEGQWLGRTVFFAYEVCDPVQGDGGYTIDGVPVANFLFPTWYIGNTAEQYDYNGTLDAPWTISSGGTLSYFRTVGDWKDVTSNPLLPKVHPLDSRRRKRRKRSQPNYGKGVQYNLVPHPHTKDK